MTNFGPRLATIRAELEALKSSRDDGTNPAIFATELEFQRVLGQQEAYWKQRSKLHWLREGDQNTRAFHQAATIRKQNNKV